MITKILLLLTLLVFCTTAEERTPEEIIQAGYTEYVNTLEPYGKRLGLGSELSWSIDLTEGTITFNFEGGKKAVSRIQIIGTYAENGTFMWGWDHPSVHEKFARTANRVKKFGEQHNLEELTTRNIGISQQRAMEYTAFAATLDRAASVYRVNNRGIWIYMTLSSFFFSG